MKFNAINYILNRLCNDRLKSIAPCRIQIGDIVEVMMSIVFIPIKNRRFKMTIKLRGILILDTTYTDVSINDKYTSRRQILKHIINL